MRESLILSAKEQQRSEVVSRWLAGILTTGEAIFLLDCSERTAWRLRAAMVRDGAAGLAHGNRGRPSPRRLAGPVRERIVELARTTYRGYNDSHLAEALAEDEGITIARSSLQRLLRAAGQPSPMRLPGTWRKGLSPGGYLVERLRRTSASSEPPGSSSTSASEVTS